MRQETLRLRQYRHLCAKSPGIHEGILACRGETAGSREDLLYIHAFAPVLMDFSHWVIREAVKNGRQRLYFLARDAYPVYLAAKEICKARGLAMDCRYLKVSRYALRMAEYSLMGEDFTDRLCIGGIRVTLRRILARGGAEAVTEDIAAQIGMAGREDAELTYAQIIALKGRLRDNALLRETVRGRSAEAFPAVLGYLDQEGLLEEIPYALVDSGWVGTLQQTMEALLRTRRKDLRLEGYYFGLYELPAGTDPSAYHSFYFSPRSGLLRKVSFSNCLFETLCSAPHGMTVAYEKKENRYVPVLDGQGLNQERMARFCALFERFAKAAARAGDGQGGGDASCSEKLLRELMGHPQPWEAEAFGTLLFCDDVLEKTVQQVAAPLTDEEIRMQRFFSKACIMLGIKKGEIHESAWIEGSIVRGGRSVKSNLLHAKLYKSFVYIRKWIKTLRRAEV